MEQQPDNEQAERAARAEKFAALTALYQRGDLAAVLREGEALARQYPDAVFLYGILGNANAGLQRWDTAISCLTKAAQLRPDMAQHHNNLGKTLSQAGHQTEAIACFTRALTLKPDYADAHYSLGVVLRDLRRPDEAIAHFRAALGIRPDLTEANDNLGLLLRDQGRLDEAIACFKKSLRTAPASVATTVRLGVTFDMLGNYPDAIACFTKALELNPNLADTRAQKLYRQLTICDWDALAAEIDTAPNLGLSEKAVRPLIMLLLEDNPRHHRIRSELFVQERYKPADIPPIAPPSAKPTRLRIGYFSACFHDHPVMHQLAGLFEMHDRSQFAVHAYSYGPPSDHALRTRVEAGVDVFHDVRALSDREIAERAHADGIDIAIDLMGHSDDRRTAIFAHRAAPIQIAYLGYPGTMGAPFIDYMIADKTVIPADQREFYSENILYLPASFMAQDNSREISSRPMTRAEMGLPENGFVFCCFNAAQKISPAEFDIWMRLLAQVEASVLWLNAGNEWARTNLEKEAAKRAIDPARIIFANRLPMAEHLARHRLADLFLDTFHYNAHSTASDALWSGLPIVTKAAQGFAARVAASLLNAVGLPDLITTSAQDYERLALALAVNPEKLAEVRARLDTNRKKAPLFDSGAFARHIENAYRQAYERFFTHQPPGDIEIP